MVKIVVVRDSSFVWKPVVFSIGANDKFGSEFVRQGVEVGAIKGGVATPPQVIIC